MNGSDPRNAGRRGSGALDLKGILKSAWTYRLFRMVISVIFIGSGITKLIAPNEFAVIIESYGLIPDAWIFTAAVFLAALEMIAGFGLLVDIRGSLSVITGLLILFMAVLSYGIWLGLDIDCGCFGTQDPKSKAFHGLWAAFVRDMMMLPVIFYLYYRRLRFNVEPKRLTHFFKGGG
ncbi:MAG: MauE/DoxX family redox-associated membrane protein [Desulfobacterales bacterium]